ncbi:MAG: hypothetical protein K6F30_07375, partial [Lachnospiraceae bacterium]|nr:hypothetical protein [Lachnospiraceae bacterium]
MKSKKYGDGMDIFNQYKKILEGCRLFEGFTSEEIKGIIEASGGEIVTISKKKKYFLPEHLTDIYIALRG